ncbi:tetratricopeptide repeat protein [Breznakiellaceae bacterium SP9]
MAASDDESVIGQKIADGIQKNRKGIFAVFGALVVILLGMLVVWGVQNYLTTQAISQVEALSRQYEALRIDIAGTEDAERQAEIKAFEESLSSFAASNKGYAGVRANAILGTMQMDKKLWEEAQSTWIRAAGNAGTSYLAPVAYYNAAVCAEEQDKNADAIDLYSKSLTFKEVFPGAARAQFAIGRLQEAQENKAAAIEAYQAVVDNWAYEYIWNSLAQSRIIVLSLKEAGSE